jgi:hypothetical protein
MTHDNDRERRFALARTAVADAIVMISKGATFETIRGDLVTARQTVRRAIAGDDADLATAAGLIDAALASLCPHDATSHYIVDTDAGEELVTCSACNVS